MAFLKITIKHNPTYFSGAIEGTFTVQGRIYRIPENYVPNTAITSKAWGAVYDNNNMQRVIQKTIYEQFEIETSITEISNFENLQRFSRIFVNNETGEKDEYVYIESTYEKVGGATMFIAKIKLYKVNNISKDVFTFLDKNAILKDPISKFSTGYLNESELYVLTLRNDKNINVQLNNSVTTDKNFASGETLKFYTALKPREDIEHAEDISEIITTNALSKNVRVVSYKTAEFMFCLNDSDALLFDRYIAILDTDSYESIVTNTVAGYSITALEKPRIEKIENDTLVGMKLRRLFVRYELVNYYNFA